MRWACRPFTPCHGHLRPDLCENEPCSASPVQLELVLMVHLRHDGELLLEFLTLEGVRGALCHQLLLLPLQLLDALCQRTARTRVTPRANDHRKHTAQMSKGW